MSGKFLTIDGMKIEINNEKVLVSNDYMSIEVANDKVIYQDGFSLLTGDFSVLTKITDIENK